VSKKPARPREAARRDVEAAVDHYGREAGAGTAIGFIDALQIAYRFFADRPASGSPRYPNELGLPGLRSRMLRRYPYFVFTLSVTITSMSGVWLA
jgi:toxin ParE1/3/4